jgi:hypothetical protein
VAIYFCINILFIVLCLFSLGVAFSGLDPKFKIRAWMENTKLKAGAICSMLPPNVRRAATTMVSRNPDWRPRTDDFLRRLLSSNTTSRDLSWDRASLIISCIPSDNQVSFALLHVKIKREGENLDFINASYSLNWPLYSTPERGHSSQAMPISSSKLVFKIGAASPAWRVVCLA